MSLIGAPWLANRYKEECPWKMSSIFKRVTTG
jgi:hypothetical protein